MIIELIKTNGKEKVITALNWMPKLKGSKTQDEAIQAFRDFVVNDFDEISEFKSGTSICRDKTNPVDCANYLFNTSAMANYFTSKL